MLLEMSGLNNKELYEVYEQAYEYYKVYMTIYYKTWVKPFWKIFDFDVNAMYNTKSKESR